MTGVAPEDDEAVVQWRKQIDPQLLQPLGGMAAFRDGRGESARPFRKGVLRCPDREVQVPPFGCTYEAPYPFRGSKMNEARKFSGWIVLDVLQFS